MKKSTLISCICVIVACLLIFGFQLIFNRTTSREGTAEEIQAHAVYAVDWTAVPGWEEGMSEKDFILSMCTFTEEKEIGSNVHKVYSSDQLADHLYLCSELSEITILDGTLFLNYYTSDSDMVILAYNDDGLTEMGVYDSQTDTLYHQLDGTVTVFEKFQNGLKIG